MKYNLFRMDTEKKKQTFIIQFDIYSFHRNLVFNLKNSLFYARSNQSSCADKAFLNKIISFFK